MKVKKMLKKSGRLLSMKHGDALQFVVTLDGYELQCDEIVRLLPGRRLVARAFWKDKPVIAKLFMSHRAKSHMERELAGHSALQKVGLLTPELIYSGPTDINDIYVVVYEQLAIDQPVDEIWKGNDDGALVNFLEQAHDILVKQHSNGIYQADLHPHNFLISNGKVYSIDYSTLVLSKSLSQQDEINVLAGFYTQLYIRHHHLVEKIFKHYCQLRGWMWSDELFSQLCQAEVAKRQQRIARLRRRILRNSSAVKFSKSYSETYAVTRGMYENYASEFFELPLEYLRSSVSVPLKLGNSASVFQINFPGHHLMVKRYRVKNAWQWFRRCWRTSRARKSWINANILKMLGLPVREPVAFFEYHFLGLTGQAYYIAQYLDGEPLKDYVEKKLSEKDQDDLVEQMFSIFYQFKVAQACHGDCKATNFIVTPDNAVWLIDVDNMKVYNNPAVFEQRFTKEMARFLRNWSDGSVFKQKLVNRLKALDLNYNHSS